VFAVTSAVGFVIGFALFGALTYLPLFQQVVRGDSPTESGLQLIPVMAGVLLGSIGSGQIITRTGRYKLFPIVGTALSTAGMLLLSTLDEHTSSVLAGVFMFVMGLGLGLVMQVLVLAVQNAVDYRQLGVATSGATLFRSIGGAIGTAALGAVFTNKLTSELADAGASGSQLSGAGALDTTQLAQLPPAQHEVFTHAFTDSISTVFVVATVAVAVAFLLTWLIEERPLRQTVETADLNEAFAAPTEGDSLHLVIRDLARLVGRERTRAFIARTVEAAGVDLPGPGAWLLVRGAEGERLDDPDRLAEGRPVEPAFVEEHLVDLRNRSLVADGRLTPEGQATAERLLAARRQCLGQLVEDWEPDGDAALNAAIDRLARELGREAPVAV
jgi:MFS family permease